MSTVDERVPLALAALALSASAERIRRRVQTGDLAGGVDAGRWFVWRSAIDAAKQAAGSVPVAA